MKDVSKLTAVDILALKTPEQLFTGDEDVAKIEYRNLSKIWHPDRNKAANATEVFTHFKLLYEQAEVKFKAGTWETPGLHIFSDIRGKKFQIKYRRRHTFELGEMFVGDYSVTYFIDKSSKDLYENAVRTIKGFKFANDKMKAEVAKYLPEIHSENETADHMVLVVKKQPDMLLLRDVLDHLGGKIDPKHVAWILSTIYNLSCYLKYAGLTHNAISPDTYFISPPNHSGLLLGGWWYAAPANQKLVAVPARTVLYAPRNLTNTKVADPKIDSELIRAVGRELLGDVNGSKLPADPNIPNALLNWLRTPGTGDAWKEYESWAKTVLKDSFGERRFVELKIQPSDVYKE